MTNLSVNLNKVALLRNTRNIGIPSITRMAQICIDAGAKGITVHPRPDQRHIRPGDVYDLEEVVTAVEFNIEGNPLEASFMKIVRQVKPTQCTLVPDTPDTFTSDSGWDLTKDQERLKPIIQELQSLGSRVSLFMDADIEQISLVPATGAERIELYTEPYATAFREKQNLEFIWQQFANAAQKAQELGLGVNAGHDLNLDNLAKFCTIPNILEVSIGHALTAEALEMGFSHTVQEYIKILSKSA
ncbi:pyridoxine 5'-phosphate synthase [Pleurocapsa sp. PCC 7319]|uniref:pyridoxine 5'-phosphate synthase n=1 Tax=Pleurocapsa sp. PCC 7319 TaxID=118161 RepID=UPI00034A1D0F|nr:pyridoxine 5'-phosphate synthase [Pleurocapsa sp. PCC 7319]